MCLVIDKDKTQKYLEENKDKETVTVYKILELGMFHYRTPYMHTNVLPNSTINARAPHLSPHKKDNGLEAITWQGVHAFIKKKEALDSEIYRGSHYPKVVECTAKMSDFIAVGKNNDIAFKALTFGDL